MKMIPFLQHPQYTKLMEILPSIEHVDYGKIKVPAPLNNSFTNMVKESTLFQLIAKGNESEITSMLEKEDTLIVLNFIGTEVYNSVFMHELEEPNEVWLLLSVDKHLVEDHDFNAAFTEVELWSNAFASFYFNRLTRGHDVELPHSRTTNTKQYKKSIENIYADIPTLRREVANAEHLRYLSVVDCSVVSRLLDKGPTEMLEEFREHNARSKYEEYEDDLAEAIEEALQGIFGASGLIGVRISTGRRKSSKKRNFDA